MARLFAALLWITVTVSVARADVQLPNKVELTYLGQEGVWLRTDVSQRMLGDLRAVPLYQERIKLLEQNIALQSELLATHARVTKLAKEEAGQASGVLESSIGEVRLCEEELHSWRHDASLWFLIGAGISALLVTGAVLSMVSVKSQ